jgi:hypothetical protein
MPEQLMVPQDDKGEVNSAPAQAAVVASNADAINHLILFDIFRPPNGTLRSTHLMAQVIPNVPFATTSTVPGP